MMLQATLYFDAALVFLNINFWASQQIKNSRAYTLAIKARGDTVIFHHRMPDRSSPRGTTPKAFCVPQEIVKLVSIHSAHDCRHLRRVWLTFF